MSCIPVTVPSPDVLTIWTLYDGRTDRNVASLSLSMREAINPGRGASVSPSPYVARKMGSSPRVWPSGLQTLSDGRVHTRVEEGNPPVVRVLPEQLDAGFGAAIENEITRQGLVVVQEVLLDHVALATKAEDELLVPPGRVVAHDVPEDGSVPEADHRLRDPLGLLAHPYAQAAAEDDDLQAVAPSRARCALRICCSLRPQKRRAGDTGSTSLSKAATSVTSTPRERIRDRTSSRAAPERRAWPPIRP